MSWEMVKLGDVCNVINGFAFKSTEFREDGIPLIRISNINSNEVFVDNKINLPVNYGNQFSKFLVKRDDILIALSGATTGKYGIYNSDEDALLNQRIGLLRPKDSKLLKSYLLHYLNILQTKIEKGAQGAAQPNISTNEISNLQIPLPPLSTQKRIAEILDKADALRKKDQKLLKYYDDLAQSLFIDLFGDPVKNEKGWEVKTIKELVKNERHSIKRGPFGGALKKEIFVEKGYLVYEQYHALNDDFNFGRYFINEKTYKDLIAFDVKPHDIIISCSGVYLGKLAIVPEGAIPGIINQALLKLTLDNTVYRNDFFVKVFRHKNFREKYLGNERGAAIPNFPPISTFKEFKFICPPISLQNHFSTQIQNIEQQKERLKIQIQDSEHLFQALLKQAFNGGLAV